jgi:DNA-binding HxlR family transcriptional regulator
LETCGLNGSGEGHDILLADCPARTALDLFGGTWSVVVVYALRSGPRRHGELIEAIGGISSKVLTQTLRRLERHGLLVRERAGRNVVYDLSDLGRSALQPVAVLAEWAHTHAEAVADAQRHAADADGPSGTWRYLIDS